MKKQKADFKQGTEYQIYIGLKERDMITDINKDYVLGIMSRLFNKIGIFGFNSDLIDGYYKGLPENTLMIKFINTFNISEVQLFNLLQIAKRIFKQDCILIEVVKVKYQFI